MYIHKIAKFSFYFHVNTRNCTEYNGFMIIIIINDIFNEMKHSYEKFKTVNDNNDNQFYKKIFKCK